MLQTFVTILTAGWHGPSGPVQLFDHYYYTGLLQVQTTAQMVGYCYNKYECWSVASVSGVHACRHKFTDMTAG